MSNGDPGVPGERVGNSSEHLSDREAWARGDLPLSMDGGTNGERHEFHLISYDTAYCICGWTVDFRERRLVDLVQAYQFHAAWYRDHPEVSSLP